MKAKAYPFVAVLSIVSLLQFSSCKKDAPSLTKTTTTKVQTHATNLSSFSGPLVVSLYAGTGYYSDIDGPRLTAAFSNPYGIASSLSGALYLSDANPEVIKKISTDGIVSTLPFKTLFNPFAMTRGNDGVLYFIEGGQYYQPNTDV